MNAQIRNTPLTPQEMVPDAILRQLGRDNDPLRARGIIDAEDASLLCANLTEICGELLAFRAAARAGAYIAVSEPALPFTHPKNHAEEIANIRATDGHPDCPFNGAAPIGSTA